jgi:hypothetical protein
MTSNVDNPRADQPGEMPVCARNATWKRFRGSIPFVHTASEVLARPQSTNPGLAAYTPAVLDVLRLEPLLFPAEFGSHRTQISVNGVDILAVAFPTDGWGGRPVAGFTPSHLLGPRGLAVSPGEAREVVLGGSDTESRLVARVHRVDSEVIWDCWRVTDMDQVVKEGREVGLEIFRFDA